MDFMRQALANDDDGRRAMRGIGGLLVATGFILALFRKSGDLGEPWGAAGQFLLVAIPCAFLLGFGFLAARASLVFSAPVAKATFLWDLAGLVVAVALIGIGARPGARGPAYVGALALLLFVVVVGLDLDDSSPDDAIVGWPLASPSSAAPGWS